MSEVKRLLDGSLMNEENNLYLFMGKKVDGKPIIPDGVEDISSFYYSGIDIYSEYEGGYYLGSEENPYKYFCKTIFRAEKVALHPDTEYICSQAFYNFRGVFVLNDKLKGVGEESFKNAFDFSKDCEIRLPNGCTRIGKGAFKYNFTPPIVYLPDSITYIGKGASRHIPAKEYLRRLKCLPC